MLSEFDLVLCSMYIIIDAAYELASGTDTSQTAAYDLHPVIDMP
jgi:hypothetical protein